MTRVLTETELALLDEQRAKAKKRPVTLAEQIAVAHGRLKSSDLASPLKLADNLWVVVTLEDRPFGGRTWHVSVSLRGKTPPDDLLRSIAEGLRLARFDLEDDLRHGPLVRHIFAPE